MCNGLCGPKERINALLNKAHMRLKQGHTGSAFGFRLGLFSAVFVRIILFLASSYKKIYS